MDITDWAFAKYMVGSSLFFQVPAVYAYRYKKYDVALCSCITMILSMNYWRHPTYSWRRTLDMYWIRISGTYYLTRSLQHSYLGIPGSLMMGGCYYLSCQQYNKNQFGNWYLYHMLLHAVSSVNHMMLVHIT